MTVTARAAGSAHWRRRDAPEAWQTPESMAHSPSFAFKVESSLKQGEKRRSSPNVSYHKKRER